MKKVSLILSILFIINFNLSAQYTTTGTDFWLSYMQNFDDPANTLLYLTSDVATSGTASMPGTGWSQAFTIAANGSVMVQVPAAQNAAIATTNTALNKAIHITANHDIAVYSANQRTASSDATLVLATPALGDSYYVCAYTPFSGQPTQFIVVGVENNTTIQIIPSAAVTGGVGAGVPFNITLNQGQVYLVQSSGDLTGTKISATDVGACHNFAVFAGNRCARVPTCDYCDHLYEQMIPLKAWGKEYITVPLMTRNGDQYRIMASEAGTVININGGANINLNAGQFHEVYLTPASYIVGNNPISVAQYSRGTSCDGVTSDPFMIMLSPVEQTLDYIVFQAFNTTAINQFYTNIVSKTAYTNQVQLDGVTLAGWNTVASNPIYSYVRKNIAQGSHVITSPEGVLTSVYGFGDVESYGYLAGANIEPINVDFNIVIGNDSISFDVYQDTLNCEESINGVGFCTDGEGISGVHFDFGDGTSAVGNSVFHVYDNSGTYTVTMYFTRDISCLEESLTMLVHVSNDLPPFDFINDTIICNGGPFVINPNVTGVNFLWQNNATTPTFTVSSSGTYSLTISDNQGCSASATADVTFVNLSVSITADPISCSGVNDGSLTANPSGGNTPYIYNWSTTPAQTTQTISGLGVGTYYVTVTDANGCTSSASKSLTMPPSLSVDLSSISNVRCYGNNDGSAVVTASGGTSPYSIVWNPSYLNGFSQSFLAPGAYAYTVTDLNGCYGTGSFTITEPTEITATATSINAGCYGEPVSASVTAFGGTPPLTILWQDQSTSFNNHNIPANVNFGYTVTDGNNCSETGSVNLSSPSQLVMTSDFTNIRCKGEQNGSISINISGGTAPYTSLWSNDFSGTTQTNLGPGNYVVTVFDHNNCTITEEFFIREASVGLSLNAVVRDITCYGFNDGAILLQANGGISPYSYASYLGLQSFSGSNQTGLHAGTYNSRVTDSFGCEADTSLTIGQPAALTADYVLIDPSCIGNNDGEIILTVYGGITPYQYRFGEFFSDTCGISRLYEGIYLTEITDSNDCVLSLGNLVLEDIPVDCIRIPSAFTPNGDGVNDTWEIQGWEIFPSVILWVYNRWGQELYKAEYGDEFWDGKYEGKFVPAGSYVYVLDVRNGKKKYTGVVSVIY
ncbi:MAG TPA: gliding motility-associated C-terminal domain-containing protein [Bacteroidales bacterium]|nr:gliding motility-associated C-terminal domain-containing protein [Bacteroidales bacterium]